MWQRVRSKLHVGELLLATLLTLPLVIPYWSHYTWPSKVEMLPTGMLQYDMPYYIANARQYLDEGFDSPFYSNANDVDPDSPRIYFQPFTLLLGALLVIAPASPVLIFHLLGIVAAITGFIILSRIITRLFPEQSVAMRSILTIAVAWGGGIFALVAQINSGLFGNTFDPFLFDFMEGMWFFNLGRNFIYPTEGFYHVLTLGIYLAVLSRRKTLLFVLTLLLVSSHPFTGLQYALIVACWAYFEQQFLASGEFNWRQTAVAVLPLTAAFLYYLVFLPSYKVHESIMQQWALDWSIRWQTMLCAYGIVTAAVIFRLRSRERFSAVFTDPFNRFAAVAVTVSFILANHEFFMTPHQPVHFTRGHIWFPLMLLGLPVTVAWFHRLQPRPLLRAGVIAIWLGVLLLDNSAFMYYRARQHHPDHYLTAAEQRTLRYLRDRNQNEALIAEQVVFGYLLTAYTPIRPLVAHCFTTPFVKRRHEDLDKFFAYGVIPSYLSSEPFLVMSVDNRERLRSDHRFREIASFDSIVLFERRSVRHD